MVVVVEVEVEVSETLWVGGWGDLSGHVKLRHSQHSEPGRGRLHSWTDGIFFVIFSFFTIL